MIHHQQPTLVKSLDVLETYPEVIRYLLQRHWLLCHVLRPRHEECVFHTRRPTQLRDCVRPCTFYYRDMVACNSEIQELLKFSEAELLTKFAAMDRNNPTHRRLMLAIHQQLNIPACDCDLEILPCPEYFHPLRALPNGTKPAKRRKGEPIELRAEPRCWIESTEADQYQPTLHRHNSRSFLVVKEWKRLDAHGDPTDEMGVEYRQRGRMTRILKAGVYELGTKIDCDCPVAGREVPCPVPWHSRPDRLLSARCSWALLLWLYPADYMDPPDPGSPSDPVDYLTLRRELDTVEPALRVEVMAARNESIFRGIMPRRVKLWNPTDEDRRALSDAEQRLGLHGEDRLANGTDVKHYELVRTDRPAVESI